MEVLVVATPYSCTGRKLRLLGSVRVISCQLPVGDLNTNSWTRDADVAQCPFFATGKKLGSHNSVLTKLQCDIHRYVKSLTTFFLWTQPLRVYITGNSSWRFPFTTIVSSQFSAPLTAPDKLSVTHRHQCLQKLIQWNAVTKLEAEINPHDFHMRRVNVKHGFNIFTQWATDTN